MISIKIDELDDGNGVRGVFLSISILCWVLLFLARRVRNQDGGPLSLMLIQLLISRQHLFFSFLKESLMVDSAVLLYTRARACYIQYSSMYIYLYIYILIELDCF